MEKLAEIATGFRTIRLVYNQKSELSDFEIGLLTQYQKLHEEVLEFSNQVELMGKYFSELGPLMDEIKPRFEALVTFHQEILSFNNMKIAENDTEEINRVLGRIDKYNEENQELHEMIVLLKDKFDIAWNFENSIIEAEDKHDTIFGDFRELTHELYHNYELYEIDIVQFDTDEQEFLTMFGDINKRWRKLYKDFGNFTEEYSSFAVRFNEFIAFVEKHKQISPITIQLPEPPEPTFLNQKQFFIPADDPKISHYAPILNEAAKTGKGIEVTVNLKETETENLKRITDIIKVSQHKDKWIENIIFKIDLNITNGSTLDGDIINPLENKKLVQLFQKLGNNPIIFFFLKNIDFGVMCLAGDIILKPDTELKNGYNTEGEDFFYTEIGFTGDDITTIFNRFFDGCAAFYQYCEDTNIDTRLYIEWAIKTMKSNFHLKESDIEMTYEDVVEQYEKHKSIPYPLGNSLN